MDRKLLIVVQLITVAIFFPSANSIAPPSEFKWPLNTDHSCFSGTFNLTVNVQYPTVNGIYSNTSIPMTSDTYESYSVSCKYPSTVHELSISMLNGFMSIILDFTLDINGTTSLTSIDGYIVLTRNQTYFHDHNLTAEGMHKFSSNISLFSTDQQHSYRCYSKTSVEKFETDGIVSVTSIEFENLRIYSFANDTQPFPGYDNEIVCELDSKKDSNVVPIVVGACLAGLIVIVLAAYIIGRRRKREGYQSV